MDNYSKYNATKVEVVGKVGEIIKSNETLEIEFELKDRGDGDKILWVEALTQPENFEAGKDVVVIGKLNYVEGEYVIKANDIKIGCPSKYE
jgi:cytochrome c-type biogenesis protein CcmE